MFSLFKKPAAKTLDGVPWKPAEDTVSLAYHRDAIEALRAENESLRQASYDADRRAEAEKRNAERALKTSMQNASLLIAAENTLRAIVALETPACASIGRRMAATAKAGLPEHQVEQAA